MEPPHPDAQFSALYQGLFRYYNVPGALPRLGCNPEGDRDSPTTDNHLISWITLSTGYPDGMWVWDGENPSCQRVHTSIKKLKFQPVFRKNQFIDKFKRGLTHSFIFLTRFQIFRLIMIKKRNKIKKNIAFFLGLEKTYCTLKKMDRLIKLAGFNRLNRKVDGSITALDDHGIVVDVLDIECSEVLVWRCRIRV
jgi:hypothetical protein